MAYKYIRPDDEILLNDDDDMPDDATLYVLVAALVLSVPVVYHPSVSVCRY